MYDEAYYDFSAGDTHFTLVDDIRPNVITLRTFSKSHGLAGLRIGFGTGAKEIIHPMLKVKLPFEPSSPAQAAGIAALDDHEFLSRTLETNRAGKRYLKEAFEKLGVKYIDTAANFFFLPIESVAAANNFVFEMERRVIIVRPVYGSELSAGVRISIGTMEENERAIKAMKEINVAVTFKASPELAVGSRREETNTLFPLRDRDTSAGSVQALKVTATE
jgi:histidinol-phosphate aminotransferase